MGITKEQWQQLESELSHSLGCAKLTCDGFDVNLEVRRIDTLKYGIVVFVNGVSKGRWIIEDCEERRRFLRPVQRFINGAKLRADLIKIWGGKRAPKAKVEKINEKMTCYYSYWTSVKALRRHLEKNNQQVELVSLGMGV
jgi:hypothetical protein